MSKDHINKLINQLELYGFRVYNFSTNRKLPKSLRGLPDYLIIGHGYLYFLELKLIKTKDKFREHQLEFAEFLNLQNFKEVKYYVINEKNLYDIIATILRTRK